ncbi:prepilin-type N-terminal cleavage/methylation domain-containing protein [Oligoflexaceae bacterium]|nr:prepilin-type N-terminal cleavage/methylation domain-containing protein [Oligoflexaceae bacterium]
MKKTAQNHYQKGFSLVEVIISIGLLAGVAVGANSIFSNYTSSVKLYAKKGEKEDIQRYFKNSIDCRNTVRIEKTICKLNGGIRGYDRNNAAVISNALLGKTFPNGSKVKLSCSEHSYYYEIQGTLTDSDGTSQPLLDIPKYCPKLDCQGLPAWTDPFVFDPGNSGNMRAWVQARAAVCGLPGPTDAITRSTGAEKRTSAGQTNYGVEDLTTLRQVCKILGYKTYVSSRCRDDERSGRYPNGKCNYHSNHDENHSYYDGSSWRLFHEPYYRTFLTGITCKDKN